MKKQIFENRFEDWKGSHNLTFIDRADGNHIVEYNGLRYAFSDLTEALSSVVKNVNDASAKQIQRALKVVKPINSLNEMKYDWNHIDPRTGMPRIKECPEDKIELMSRMPARSCWIIMLQNRVLLNSVGNKRYQSRVWFDRRDATVSSDRSKEDAVHFRSYRLPMGQVPQGWIEDTNQSN